MIQKLFITLIFTGMLHALSAQTDTHKQAVTFSVHPFTMYTLVPDRSLYMHDEHNVKHKEYEALMGAYGYQAVGYDTQHYGAWEIAYKRSLNPQLQFDLALSCELSSKHWDLYDRADGPREKRVMDYRVNLMPGLHFLTRNYQRTHLSFFAQAGVEWIHRGVPYFEAKERDKYRFAWQVWYILDPKLSDSFDLNIGFGYGTMGIVKIGISYPF
jgi:hypothetical protein